MIKNAILKIFEDIGANEDNSRCDEPPKRIVSLLYYIFDILVAKPKRCGLD